MYKQRQEGGYKEEEEEDGDMIEATSNHIYSNHMVTGTPLNKKNTRRLGFFFQINTMNSQDDTTLVCACSPKLPYRSLCTGRLSLVDRLGAGVTGPISS